jgi:hypothetical protein
MGRHKSIAFGTDIDDESFRSYLKNRASQEVTPPRAVVVIVCILKLTPPIRYLVLF